MWSSTVGRFESGRRSFQRNTATSSGTLRYPSKKRSPWKCSRLLIGTGTGALPVMDEVKREAEHQRIELLIMPTAQAIRELEHSPTDTNAILHVTC
jgi:hypothetical protein